MSCSSSSLGDEEDLDAEAAVVAVAEPIVAAVRPPLPSAPPPPPPRESMAKTRMLCIGLSGLGGAGALVFVLAAPCLASSLLLACSAANLFAIAFLYTHPVFVHFVTDHATLVGVFFVSVVVGFYPFVFATVPPAQLCVFAYVRFGLAVAQSLLDGVEAASYS